MQRLPGGVTAEWLLNGNGPMFEHDREYPPQLDKELLCRVLMTLDDLIPQPRGKGDHRVRAEVAVATYQHGLRPAVEPKQLSD